MKGKEKLTGVNKLLVDWITKFDKDNEKEFKEKGIELIIIEGLRTLETQKKYFAEGKSKTMNSKHLTGNAIDICFSEKGKINWSSMQYWTMAHYHFIQHFKNIKDNSIVARWGGDFNMDGRWEDSSFLDAPHFEIFESKTKNTYYLLKLNSKGEEVKLLQSLLNKQGYKLVEDGDFGANTESAVKDFQTKNKLKVDGVVGESTLKKLKGELK